MMTEGRKLFYHYMFTTAVEGGIGYWSLCDEYHWSKAGAGAITGVKCPPEDLDDFYAVLTSNEDDWGVEEAFVSEANEPNMIQITETQSLRVDLKVMERGWNLFMDKVMAAAKSEDPAAPFSRQYFRLAVVQYLTDMEDGDSDADVADYVVQLGLFGEVVYS